jgi:hypothetical protein
VNSLIYVRDDPGFDAEIAGELPGFPNVTSWLTELGGVGVRQRRAVRDRRLFS